MLAPTSPGPARRRTASALLVVFALGGCPHFVSTEGTSALEGTTLERIAIAPFHAGGPDVTDRIAARVRGKLGYALEQHDFTVRNVDTREPDAPGLDADALAVGTVLRYQQRLGGELGASRPASVAIRVELYRVPDGAHLWTGTYDETQRPTSESIGDVALWPDRGWKWLTADELAAYGVDQLATELAER